MADGVSPGGRPSAAPRQVIDRIVSGLLGLADELVPGRVVAAYLFGSYAAGNAVAGSDLDLALFVADDAPAEAVARLAAVYTQAGRVSPVGFDVQVYPEHAAGRPWGVWDLLRPTATLLRGADLRPRAVPTPPDRAACQAMHSAFSNLVVGRRGTDSLRFPLAAPDPTDAWLGLAGHPVRVGDGRELPGTKPLVGFVARAAKALVVGRGGGWVDGKGEGLLKAYRAAFGDDEWADLLAAVTGRCRADWGYLIPDGPAERAELSGLCRRVLAFQNHYLTAFRAFLAAEQAHANPARRQLAAGVFQTGVFGPPEVGAVPAAEPGPFPLELEWHAIRVEEAPE